MKISRTILQPRWKVTLFMWLTFIVVITIWKHASAGLMMLLIVWSYMLILCLNDWKNNIVCLCFLISFFVFLIGREVCFSYLSLPVYYTYLTPYNSFAYVCMIISLLGIGVGNFVQITNFNNGHIRMAKCDGNNRVGHNTQKIAKYIFCVCYMFSIIAVCTQILFIRQVGYLGTYVEKNVEYQLPGVVSYIAAFMGLSFYVYLSTFPDRKSAWFPIAMYELYGVLTVFTGKRYPFVAISMIIFIYMIIRSRKENGWMTRKMIVTVILLVPCLIVFLALYDSIRVGQGIKFSGIINTVINFFDGQGGSINVIKRIRYFEKEIADLHLCSFETTRSVIFENFIMRKFTGINVMTGNSIERALNGNSLMHRLSYLTYGNAYLSGRGVGSCYIAELFFDFGYLGILVGSVLYGKIMSAVNNMGRHGYIIDGILLAMMYYILLAPRGHFDAFLGDVFTIYSILGIFAVKMIGMAVRRKQYKSVLNFKASRVSVGEKS